MEEGQKETAAPAPAPPALHVAPGPHVVGGGLTTRRMMIDVLIGLAPVVIVSLVKFQHYAAAQLGICVGTCVATEILLNWLRRRPATVGDFSAVVTGIILALSLPGTAPWYVGVIGSFVAIFLGKFVFGGLGTNIFNPAMVGRAFVTLTFISALGAGGYVKAGSELHIVTQATPLTLTKQAHQSTPLKDLVWGDHNGSLGEGCAWACLLGGLYLVVRRTAAWQIPLFMLLAVALFGGLATWASPHTPWSVYWASPHAPWSVYHHLIGGATLFGAFFIATDPVSSPVTPVGKAIFGFAIGSSVVMMRLFSGYPEGVMFSVLIMNSIVPLINRWTIPTPVGGPTPAPKVAAEKR